MPTNIVYIAFALLFITATFNLQGQVKKSEFILLIKEKSKENLNYNISKITFENKQDTLGVVNLSKKKDIGWLLFHNAEEKLQSYFNENFRMNEKATLLKLRVTELKISNYKSNLASPEDTLFFKCVLTKIEPNNTEEDLFQYQSKNLMGAYDDVSLAISNYLHRNIKQCLHQFNLSYDKNPHWNKQNDTSSEIVLTTCKLNQNLGKDSIECNAKMYIDSSYFNRTTKKDTFKTIGHLRPILTYAILAEEKNGKMYLEIHTKAFISKSRSWMNSALVSQNWFTYQQGHALLCAIYGKKLNDAFKNTKFTYGEFKTQANLTYNKIYNEYIQMRKQYADETRQGENKVEVNRWIEKLEAEK